ncbi:peptide chain release factor N(5)-glutamine methyltransferase [Corynebacterium sp. sy017]|uniref:peptide chain release factor N(5)-glutamine methyltransferase n=1 Tax=unclassified Corynebacterium TaxID=2624378 RepID=UPI00118523E6|nr:MULTISPECIES: peptide chain release factor N(5)-glutamine methyltransferase [unclassified Corynebacterium]MBP3089007.1 peptide chain release factor N(5)-glutamine methyltransferase [Corynebacterium sp. sy017]TSD91329.1 peptide chain release factor N(5)-glutamine methyltransferase [Corynebacterium sp. SY003]
MVGSHIPDTVLTSGSNVAQALKEAIAVFTRAGIETPEQDALIFAAEALGCAVLEVRLHATALMPTQFFAHVAQRAQRIPVQHILGTAWFGPLSLAVGPGVFIPRPETEVLADWAVRQIGNKHMKVADLCTGSGALSAYIAHYCPNVSIVAVDKDERALKWARKNVPEHVSLCHADVCDPELLKGQDSTFDLIVSNPPYVPESNCLQPEVYHDPHHAVFSGADGMTVINGMVMRMMQLLKPGGLCGIEHDDTTSAAVRECVSATGLSQDIRVLKDLAGIDRFILAKRS